MSKLVKINNRYIRADKIKEIVVKRNLNDPILKQKDLWATYYLEEGHDNRYRIIEAFETQEEAEFCAMTYANRINEAM